MPRPSLTKNPAFPEQKSPVPGRESELCGSTWHFDAEIRKPYMFTDEFNVLLPALGLPEMGAPVGAGGVFATDTDTLKAVYHFLDSDVFGDSHQNAQVELDGFVAEGYVTRTNRKAIQTMLDRSVRYFNQAAELKTYWFGYVSDNSIPFMSAGMGWPLWEDIVDRWDGTCEFRRAPDKGELLVGKTEMTEGKMVSYTCPTQEKVDEHEADAIVIQKIAHAAAMNLRCAQEAIFVVAFYEKNKEIRTGVKKGTPGHVYTLGIAPKKEPVKKAGLVPLDTGEPEWDPGAPSIPEPEPEPPVTDEPGVEPPPPAKKKSNALLIVGVAAVGLMLLTKK